MKIKHVYGNVLRIDIPLTIKIRTIEEGAPSEREEPFYPDVTKGCIVELANNYNRKIEYEATINDNIAHIEDIGKISIGRYKITVKCYDADGNPYRYMARDIVEICDATADAGIESGVEFNAKTYTLEGAVFIAYGGGSFEQVQADWAETDDALTAFIKNKPDVRSVWDMEIPQNPTAEERRYVPTVGSVADTLEGVEDSLKEKQDKLSFTPPIVTDNDIPRLVETTTGNFNPINDVATAEGDGWHNVQYKDRTIPTIAAIEAQGYLTQHQDIGDKENRMRIAATTATSLAAAVGTYYRFTSEVGTLAVTLPTMTDTSHTSSVVLYMTTGASPSITFTSTYSVVYQKGFSLDANKTYEVKCLFNGAAWVLAAVEINTGS